MSQEADMNGVEFKIKGLKINGDNYEDDLPPPPPIIIDEPGKYTDNHIEKPVFDTEVSLLPPPPSPPLEVNSYKNYVWTPPGLSDEQVSCRRGHLLRPRSRTWAHVLVWIAAETKAWAESAIWRLLYMAFPFKVVVGVSPSIVTTHVLICVFFYSAAHQIQRWLRNKI